MSSVDDRIVSMKFENSQFEAGAKSSLSILDRLKSALSFSGTSKGLNDLQNTANRFSLSGIANATSGISGKFLVMAGVAIQAISSIVAKAASAGLNIAKAFTFKPVMDGFHEYETNLNSVQTILANTQSAGTKLKDVNAALNELNTYSDKTIYNFSEMARNIGTFTAAGVGLKPATAAIKGIANLAALSGSNSQQASTAMYQLSQAISAGKVGLQDWNSVVNAGMGGTVFQRALATTAENMGTLDKGTLKLSGSMKNVTIGGKSFRESLTAKPGEKSWLTSEVLTKTLAQFTGDLSDADLAAQGFSKSQIKAIQAQAKTAQEAATQVKTFSALIDTLQEGAGSGWATTFQILLGDFDEARSLFTEVSNVIGGFISKSAKARNAMLQQWKDLGGRTALLSGIKNVFEAIVGVLTPIKEAFREIFPATTGKQLYALTLAFLEFTKNLKIGATTASNLKRTFAGVFAIFDIGWQAVKALFGVFKDLFGLLFSGAGGFLNVTGNIGDFIVSIDKAIKKGDLFTKFFQTLEGVLYVPIALVKSFAQSIADLVKGWKSGGFKGIGDAFGHIGDRLAPLSGIGGRVSAVWNKLIDVFRRVGSILAPAIHAIGDAFSGIGDAIAKAFKAGDFNSVYDAINTGLLAGIIVLITKFFKNGFKIDIGSGGFLGSIKETFETLTSSLSALQTQIKAKTLFEIAAAVALLTVSIVALSLIDSAKLTKAMGAISVAFGQLLGAMAILTKISGTVGFTKIPVISAGMVILATAVLILTAAVKNLSGLDWNGLVKGLVGVAAILVMIVGVAKGLDKSGGSLIRVGLAMIPLAIGLKIIASAVKDFAKLKWGDIAKGLVGIAGSLVVIGLAMRLMPKSMVLQAAGLVILGIALKGIGEAIADMGGMSWGQIAKGMVTLAGGLIIIAAALLAMDGAIAGAAALIVAAGAIAIITPALKEMGDLKWGGIAKIMVTLLGVLALLAAGMYVMSAALPGAAALIVAAGALRILAPALAAMGELKWGAIAKVMVTLAGTLLILAVGLTAMALALPGAAALVIITGALAAFIPVLVAMGSLSWETIGKGLLVIAASLTTLALTSALLIPFIPAVLALSVALVILGAAMTLIGAGAILVATAFSIFVAAGSAGIIILTGMINLIPLFLKKFAEGIIGFATTIASQADKFTRAFVSLLSSLLDAVIQITPKLARTLDVMIRAGLDVLVTNAPRFADAGLKILLAFLRAIRDHISQIVPVVVDLVVRFINALSAQQGRVLDAGARFIIRFINGLASTIRSHSGEMRAAGARLGSAILSGMTGGLSDGAWRVVSAAARVAARALQAAMHALGIHSPSRKFAWVGEMAVKGFAGGLDDFSHKAENSATDMGTNTIDAIKKSLTNASSIISDSMDFNPTVKPVLDISNITANASKIGQALGDQKVTASLSYGQANGISNAQNVSTANDISTDSVAQQPTSIVYQQYNTSPKALDNVEIYRNTKSLINMTKESLGVRS